MTDEANAPVSGRLRPGPPEPANHQLPGPGAAEEPAGGEGPLQADCGGMRQAPVVRSQAKALLRRGDGDHEEGLYQEEVEADVPAGQRQEQERRTSGHVKVVSESVIFQTGNVRTKEECDRHQERSKVLLFTLEMEKYMVMWYGTTVRQTVILLQKVGYVARGRNESTLILPKQIYVGKQRLKSLNTPSSH